MANDDDILARLEQWLAGRHTPPTVFDVIETGNGELFAAYVLKSFRAAAAEAVSERISREGAKLFPTSSNDLPAAAMRVFDRLARAWSLTEAEQLVLLGLQSSEELVGLSKAHSEGLPPLVLERLAIVLDIFQAVHMLQPGHDATEAWIRKPNKTPVFAGRSALDLMQVGLEGLREVRAYLQGQLSGLNP